MKKLSRIAWNLMSDWWIHLPKIGRSLPFWWALSALDVLYRHESLQKLAFDMQLFQGSHLNHETNLVWKGQMTGKQMSFFLVWDTYFKINIFDWSQICFAFVAELSSSFSLLCTLHGDKKCIGNKSRLLLANSLVNLWKKILYKVVWLFIISW